MSWLPRSKAKPRLSLRRLSIGAVVGVGAVIVGTGVVVSICGAVGTGAVAGGATSITKFQRTLPDLSVGRPLITPGGRVANKRAPVARAGALLLEL